MIDTQTPMRRYSQIANPYQDQPQPRRLGGGDPAAPPSGGYPVPGSSYATPPQQAMAGALTPPTGPSLESLISSLNFRGGGTGQLGSKIGSTAGAVGGSLLGPAGATTLGLKVGTFGGPVGMAIGAGLGALGGLIGGAINKHAASAPSDVSVEQAATVITQAIREAYGREPQPGEVDEIIRGQGWKPGDRWVGSGGLQSVLRSIDENGQKLKAGQMASQPQAPIAATGMVNAPPSMPPAPSANPLPNTPVVGQQFMNWLLQQMALTGALGRG